MKTVLIKGHKYFGMKTVSQVLIFITQLWTCSRAILTSDSWRLKFLSHDIVPEVWPRVPVHPLQVNFSSAAVDFGNILRPEQTRSEPIHIDTKTGFGHHLLIMTDLDYPSANSSERREYLHWMVFNIVNVNLIDGHTLAAYVSPEKSGHKGGEHRYMLTYFQQLEGPLLDFQDFAIPAEDEKNSHRKSFCTRTFTETNLLGPPKAANFFRIKWEWEIDSHKH